MPGSFGKLGRRGKDACGIRGNLKVCAASKSRFDLFCLYSFSDAALAFAQRSQINVASSTLQVWHKRLATQQGAQAFAMQYARVQLQFRVLFTWRVQLRAHLKLFRQAKIAHKYFVMRRAWRVWVDRAEARGREMRLREWNKGRVGKLFSSTSRQLTFFGAPCGLRLVLVLQVGRKRHLGYAAIDLQSRKFAGVLMRYGAPRILYLGHLFLIYSAFTAHIEGCSQSMDKSRHRGEAPRIRGGAAEEQGYCSVSRPIMARTTARSLTIFSRVQVCI